MGTEWLALLALAALTGCAPVDVAEEPADPGIVWVSDVEAGEVRSFDAGTGEMLGTVLVADEVDPEVAPRGFQPAGLAFWQQELVVTNFTSGQVFSVDPTDGSLVHVWYERSDRGPRVEEPVALAPLDGGLAVLGNDTRNVVRMDPTDADEASELVDQPVRYGHGLVRWGDQLIVATSPFQRDLGLLQRFDAATGASLGDFGFWGEIEDATGVTLGPDGLLYVTDWWAGEVVRYDPATGELVDRILQGLDQPVASAFSTDGALLVVTRHELIRVDGYDPEVLTDDLVFGRGIATAPSAGIP